MSNTSGLNLREPDQMDWENYNPGNRYIPPPPAVGVDGKQIIYFGQAPTFATNSDGTLVGEEATKDDNLLQVVIDPIKIVKSGVADGYELRFTRANVKKFVKKLSDGTEKVIDASSLGNYLKACGVVAKPQKNNEYRAAVKSTSGRVFPVTIDWEARNKDTGETVRGYLNFPEDPDRPGLRKAVLRAGDVVTVRDKAGNVVDKTIVKSEVLFANARVRYFIDPNRK